MNLTKKFVVMSVVSLPNNFSPKVRFPEKPIHHQFQVVAGGGVAVQVDRTGGFEYAFHLEQAYRHRHEVYLHGFVADRFGGLDNLIELLVAVGDFAVPLVPDVLVRPDVLELGSFGGAADRRFVLPIGVERGIEVYQVYTLVVDAAQDVEVVGDEKRAVLDIQGVVGEILRGGAESALEFAVFDVLEWVMSDFLSIRLRG